MNAYLDNYMFAGARANMHACKCIIVYLRVCWRTRKHGNMQICIIVMCSLSPFGFTVLCSLSPLEFLVLCSLGLHGVSLRLVTRVS